MAKIVVVGGGFAGCAAAIAAAKVGGDVTLIERMDMVTSSGLVGGIYRNNGRFTGLEEAVAMGGGEIFNAMDSCRRHENLAWLDMKHVSLYDVNEIEGLVRGELEKAGVELRLETRAVDVEKVENKITAIIVERGYLTREKEKVEGDAFVDCTGTTGPIPLCRKYGNGCVTCIQRCISFGGRVSLAEKAGIKEGVSLSYDGTPGAMSGAFEVEKETLSSDVRRELDRNGIVLWNLGEDFSKLAERVYRSKACVQYGYRKHEKFLTEFHILDNGVAKCGLAFMPLEVLRRIPGCENARIIDPYAGSRGNSVRYLAVCPRDNTMKVIGIKNLFCAGEKSGPYVGHTEAQITGNLAGYNAVKCAEGKEYLELPKTTASGDFINHAYERWHAKEPSEEIRKERYTLSGGIYFYDAMVPKGLYTSDVAQIKKRIEDAGLTGIYYGRA